ncbi:MAG: ATP-binding cassette subfamily F protein 3 [Chlamydiales bacterium]
MENAGLAPDDFINGLLGPPASALASRWPDLRWLGHCRLREGDYAGPLTLGAAMSLLILNDVKKHFGAQEVLSGASLQLDAGTKLGLVGRNGGGKSTLLRIIMGEESPDWGSAILAKGTRIGSVPQRPHFEPGQTVREYVEAGLSETRSLLAALERTGEAMADAQDEQLERLMHEHDRLTHRIDEVGGWEAERQVETVLSGIGLPEVFWDREARTMSGGEKGRAALARELISGHDILLLDEPTNHLDLEGIEWIENYIASIKGAVLIVSHDRRLLQNSVDAIIELQRGKLTRYPGNFSQFINQKEERFAAEMRAWEVQSDKLRREETFIKKHMGSQRTAEAKGRAKKLGHVERLVKPHHDVRRPKIRAPKAARGGELVLQAENLTAAFGERTLFANIDLRIGRGQRIGIVGPNGSGKTTLLKILAERLAPTSGEVTHGHRASVGYYDQDTSSLHEDATPLTDLMRTHGQMTELEARSHLARFLFRGNEVEKAMPTLSGGERARLCLSKLVLTEPTWLALDEPTNHLDLAGRTALEEMLSEFDGALVCISHDREFLDGLCNYTIEVGHGTVREHDGNYSSWHRWQEEEAERALEGKARTAKKKKQAAAKASTKAPARSPKGAKGGKKRGNPSNNPYRLKKLEERIMELEEILKALHAKVATEDVYRDGERLKDTQIKIAEAENELSTANEEWGAWG